MASNKPDPDDLTYNDIPICPHCGHKQEDVWEIFLGVEDREEVTETDCGSCGKPFQVIEHISYSYSTEEIKNLDAQESRPSS